MIVSFSKTSGVTIQIPAGALWTGSAVAVLGLSFAAWSRRPRVASDPDDPAEFVTVGTELLHWVTSYRRRCQTAGSVTARVKPNFLLDTLPSEAPEESESWATIVSDLSTKIEPGLTHWQSGRFFAYFKAHASLPAVLGEMVAAGINAMCFDWVRPPWGIAARFTRVQARPCRSRGAGQNS
jgi:hypothetical protein